MDDQGAAAAAAGRLGRRLHAAVAAEGDPGRGPDLGDRLELLAEVPHECLGLGGGQERRLGVGEAAVALGGAGGGDRLGQAAAESRCSSRIWSTVVMMVAPPGPTAAPAGRRGARWSGSSARARAACRGRAG